MGKREKGREALTDSQRAPPTPLLSPLPSTLTFRLDSSLNINRAKTSLESVAISLLILFFLNNLYKIFNKF